MTGEGAVVMSLEDGNVRTDRVRRGAQHDCQHLRAKGVEDGIVGWESHRQLYRGCNDGIHVVEGMEVDEKIRLTLSMTFTFPTETHSSFWIYDLHLHHHR
jgi:hypothetical protein